jgi:hypothetical protein
VSGGVDDGVRLARRRGASAMHAPPAMTAASGRSSNLHFIRFLQRIFHDEFWLATNRSWIAGSMDVSFPG